MPLFSPLVERATEIAAEWHDGTYRKGRWTDPILGPPETGEATDTPGVPAMAHVTAVAMTVARAGWGEDAIAAAFLHDTLEDRDRHSRFLARERLAELVGERVVEIVTAVTEPKVSGGGAPLPWRTRKEAYLRVLREGAPEAAAVSLADKLHNAYAMASSLEAGIDIFRDAPGRKALSAGPEDQLWFFHAVMEATAPHEDPRLGPLRRRLADEVERFARAVASVKGKG